MKKLSLLIVVALGVILSTSTFAATTNNYILVEGRSAAMNPVVQLTHNINNSGVSIDTRENNNIGSYFNIYYVENGQNVAMEKIHLSNSIISNLKRHLANPQTGESILAVCGQQAGGFTRIINLARNRNSSVTITTNNNCGCKNANSHSSGCDLSEVNARLQRIEDNQTVLNDNINASYQQTALMSQKMDDLIAATNENTRQIKKARTESWIQTGVNLLGQVASTAVVVNQIKKDKRPNTITTTNTTNTTTINYGGGSSETGETWGGNTNRGGRGGIIWGGNYNN